MTTPHWFIDVKVDFHAVGNGSHDDGPAIRNAFAAAVSADGPAGVWFPPGEYLVSRDLNQQYCLDLPASGIELCGVRGRSWFKAAAGLPAGVVVLNIDHKADVTIRDLGIDGNWGNPKTEIAPDSHGVALPTATIAVADTAGFPDTPSSIVVIACDGSAHSISYTGVTATSFTGCSGGTGTLSVGSAVGHVDGIAGLHHVPQVDPKCHGIAIRGGRDITIDNCRIRQCYGDGIWIGHAAAEPSKQSSNVRILHSDIDVSARSGIAVGGPTEHLYVDGCRFTNIFAQAFDTEPVGTNGYARDVTLRNVFLDGWWNPANPARSINSPLSIQGGSALLANESNRARQYRVRDCTVMGSVLISDAVDVVFEHNRVICDFPGFSYAPVHIDADCDDIWVVDNYIYDRTSARVGNSHDAAVSVQVSDGSFNGHPVNQQPSGVHVRGNRIHARNGRHGIKAEGTGAFAVHGGGQLAPEAATATAIVDAAAVVFGMSDGKQLPRTTIDAQPTTAFPDSGVVGITTHDGVEVVTYTGKTATTFTGCTGGTSVLHAGDPVVAHVLTDGARSWTPDQWVGRTVRTGGRQATVLSNSGTQLFLDPGGWRTMLGHPADPAVSPPPGPYTIYGSPALVDIENNTIECTDDGFGHGGHGIFVYITHAGMRVRCHRNEVINAGGEAIRVATIRPCRILHLELTDNVAVDTQLTRTCDCVVNFPPDNQQHPLIPIVQRWIMRGNEPALRADGTPTPTYTGLTAPAKWMLTDGTPAEWTGYGSPEGAVTAGTGSTYRRLDGDGSPVFYVKESAEGNTGWTPTASGSPTAPDWLDQLDLAGAGFDPVALGSATAAMTAGRVFLTKVRAYRPTFSTVLVQVAAAPAGAAHCHLGIYRSDGAQTAEMRAATVDALATVATTGIATITLTNPVTVAPGDDVYVAVLVTGSPTTPLQLRACAGSPAINGNLVAGQGLRCGASGAGLTALPPAVDLSAMTTVAAMAWTAVR